MPLKYKVDSLDAIDEKLRDLYTEKDGHFVLDAEGIEGAEDVGGIKSALASERKLRAAAEKKAREIAGKFGDLDPERIEELLKAEEDRQTKDAEAKGQYERIKTAMAEKHAKELEGRNAEIGRITKALERALIDAEATRAISAAEGVVKVLLPHVRSRVQLVDEEGEFAVRVLGADGKVAFNGNGEPMNIEGLIKELRDDPDFGGNFRAGNASGSGAANRQAAGGGGNGRVRTRADLKTPAAKAAFIREAQDRGEDGVALFMALPEK